MLLNKYQHLHAISRDDFAEELLFKIEKNVINKNQLEDSAFPYLHAMLKQKDGDYASLLTYAHKFNTLADNVDYVYKILAKHLNKKT